MFERIAKIWIFSSFCNYKNLQTTLYYKPSDDKRPPSVRAASASGSRFQKNGSSGISRQAESDRKPPQGDWGRTSESRSAMSLMRLLANTK